MFFQFCYALFYQLVAACCVAGGSLRFFNFRQNMCLKFIIINLKGIQRKNGVIFYVSI